jgi:hypothetical protein
VKIGMTVQEAEQALDAKLDPISSEFGKECRVTSRSDKKDRVMQYIVEDENIAAIDVYPSAAEAFPLPIPAIGTPEGIGVGSTEERIRRAYGKSARKERAPYFDEDNKDTEYWIHVDNPAKKLGMIFDVRFGLEFFSRNARSDQSNGRLHLAELPDGPVATPGTEL